MRLRNYLEVRCFDGLPWPEARSVVTLVSGLIYCEKAFTAADALSRALVVEDAARRGLEAVAPDGRSFREVARAMESIAAATLGGETSDWAVPGDLDAVRRRIG